MPQGPKVDTTARSGQKLRTTKFLEPDTSSFRFLQPLSKNEFYSVNEYLNSGISKILESVTIYDDIRSIPENTLFGFCGET